MLPFLRGHSSILGGVVENPEQSTLQETNISHQWERKLIFPTAQLEVYVIVPWEERTFPTIGCTVDGWKSGDHHHLGCMKNVVNNGIIMG